MGRKTIRGNGAKCTRGWRKWVMITDKIQYRYSTVHINWRPGHGASS
jgi:hypothetical protein